MRWDIYYNKLRDRYAAINYHFPSTTLIETGHFDLVLSQRGYFYYAYSNILQAIIQCSLVQWDARSPRSIQFHDWDYDGDLANLAPERLVARFGMSFIGTLTVEMVGSQLKGRTAIDSLESALSNMIAIWNESQCVRDENASKSVCSYSSSE